MWLLPSRGRPKNLARFFEAYRKTGGSTPGMVLLGPSDEGDAGRPDLPLGWFYQFCQGETQGEKIAEIWDRAKDCAWLGLIGDDCVPETPGWDRLLLEALDGSNIVSCNDGWQAPNRLGNCWIMSGDVVRGVGYIFPPGLQHLYVDDVWEELARRARQYLPPTRGVASDSIWLCRMDVMVHHRHVLKGEAAPDDTHRAVYGSDTTDPNAGLWPTDRAAYEAWLCDDAERATKAILALRPATDDQPESAFLEEEALKTRRIARAKSRSVLMATPCHGAFEANFARSIINTVVLFERMGIRHDEQWVLGSSNLPKARNHLAAHFLAGKWDDLLMIDSDMGWAANSALRLIASDKPVIGAVGRRKCEEPSWCATLLPGPVNQDDMGALEVRRVGTGFLKVSREALEAIIAARPDLKQPGDPHTMTADERANYHRFFAFSEHDGGEDYFFCDLWRSVGGQVWIDPSIELGHAGTKEYVGTFHDALTPPLVNVIDTAEAA